MNSRMILFLWTSIFPFNIQSDLNKSTKLHWFLTAKIHFNPCVIMSLCCLYVYIVEVHIKDMSFPSCIIIIILPKSRQMSPLCTIFKVNDWDHIIWRKQVSMRNNFIQKFDHYYRIELISNGNSPEYSLFAVYISV